MDNKENKRKREINSEDYEKNRSKKRRSRSKTPKEREDRNSRRRRRDSRSPNDEANREKRRNDTPKEIDTKREAPIRKTKETDMLNTRTGGAYIPPARLRMMQAQITDKSSIAYQRLAWEALKKSIHGHINKINVGNIGIIIKELLKENIVRGRGLLCRSVIQAQAASPTFTNVYAALVAAVNSRFPNIGELLLKRLVIQFKRGFKRNDKPTCISSVSFVAHLVNQKVAHEILALEILTLLVESPTDDSVEVAIAFLKECGQKLTEVSSKGVNAIFEMLRNILHEGQLDKRVQYMIEVMFQVWKDGFKDHPAVIEELELVPEEEQFTHLLTLDDATNAQDILNVFKFDEKYEENEQKYKTLCKEILGSDAESGEEDGSGESGSEESEEEEEEEKKDVTIIDNTETNLVALRRTIYLTINSSLDFEECAHKLMKMQLKPGQEIELCHMFLDCCAEQRTYEKFYGLLAQRFCNINRIYIGPFEEIFKDSYSTAHRLDTNRLRNVSKFFAHLLFTDSISWEVLECVKLNEEDTTSSSRIYIKILFQELAEYMGLKKLNDRLRDPTLQEAFSGIFPRDNPKNTRFSINFFTSIGLGGLTDELREHLKQMPKNVPPPVTEINVDSDSSSSDSSSSSSSSEDSSSDSSSSDSEDEQTEKNKKKNKTSKSKKPKTPEPEEQQTKDKDKTERWGHDGFYDTYGPGARRLETNRSERDNRDKGFNKEKRRNEPLENDSRYTRNRQTEELRNTEGRTRNYEERREKYRESDNRRNIPDERETRKHDDGQYSNVPRGRDRREEQDQYNREGRRERDQRDREEDNISNDKDKRNYKSRNDQYRTEDNYAKRHRENKRRERNSDEEDNRNKRTDRRERNSDEEDNRYKRTDRRERNSDEEDNRYKRTDRRERYSDEEDNRYKRTDRRKENLASDRNESREKRKEKHVSEEDEMRDKQSDLHRERRLNNENEYRDKNDKRREKCASDEDDNYKKSDRRKEKKSDISQNRDKRKGKQDKYSSDEESTKDKRKNKNDGSSKSKRKEKKKGKEIESDSGRDSASDYENKKRRKGAGREKSKKSDSNLGGRYWDSFDIDPKEPTEKFEGRTPEQNEKNYDRRRER